MATTIEKITSPASRDEWWKICRLDPDALLSQTPLWTDCICSTEGYEDVSRLYEMKGGKRIVLPMVRRRTILRPFVPNTSLPHGWGNGGPLAPGSVCAAEIAALIADLEQQPALSVNIRPTPLNAQEWVSAQLKQSTVIPRVSHILDLSAGFDRVWTQVFSSKTRNKIRKAERSGVEVQYNSTGEYVSLFYDMYLTWLDHRAGERRMPRAVTRWTGKRREPLHRFEAVARLAGESCRIYVASLAGIPVAATILLLYGLHAVYWRSSSDKRATGNTRANDLLQKVMIEDACQAGCTHYHMGESGGVPSLIHFKNRFGAEPIPYAEYRVERFPVTSLQNRVDHVVKNLEMYWLRTRSRQGT